MKKFILGIFAVCVALAGNAEIGVIDHIKTIKGDKVYKTGKDTYAVITYNVRWPREFKNLDVNKLQEFVVENAFGLQGVSIEKAIEQNNAKFAEMFGGKPVNNITKENVLEMREKREDVFEKSYPECDVEVNFDKHDSERNLLIMEVINYINSDNGLGAGENFDYKKMYYDCSTGRKVEINDLIKSEKQPALLQMIKKKLLGGEEVDCVMEENVKAMSELPATFDFDDYMLYFRFAKYEVACGMANNTSIGIAIEDIKDMFTPYGKKLLMGNNSFKDDKTAAEVKKRMQEYLDFYLKNVKEEKYDKLNDRNNFYTIEFVIAERMCQRQAWEDGEETGWIDYDTWVDAQDIYNLSFEIKRVLVRNHNEAMVELVVNNCDEKRVKRVIWAREKEMCIDDYSTSGTMMRDMMIKYLRPGDAVIDVIEKKLPVLGE